MTPRVPHPDALLELHRQARLSDAARAELIAHLEQCPACAAEVWAATVLVRECEPLAGDAALDRLAVQATLAKLGALPTRAARKRRVWVWALAAALPLCAFAALSARQARHANRGAQPPVTETAAAPVSIEPSAQQPVAAPSAEPEAAATAGPSSTLGVAPAAAPRPSERAELLGPSELLRRAGDLARDSKQSQALEVYRELQQRFPASAEGKLSRVLMGSLLLAQGKYRPAVTQFDRYLTGSGPASEEAWAGRATALQALGDPSGESASWRALLERFPRSVHASRARQRLSVIAASADAKKSL